MNTDTQVIDICRHLRFVEREEAELVEHDEYAPEEHSPNHTRHQELLAEEAMLLAALTKAAPPTTLKGIRGLAEVAMMLAEAAHTPEDKLFAPKDMVEWVTLRALTSAAGKPEAIPLPEQLPDFWPA